MISILIVDDHPLVRKGIKETLNRESGMTVAGEADSAADAYRMLREGAYGVVILDVSLPDENGLEVLEKLRAIYPDLPILILTMHSEEQYGLRALKMGASGFLSKDAAPTVLIEAVRKIFQGGKFVTPLLAEKLACYVGARDEPQHDKLSNREFEIMILLAQGKSPKEIAGSLQISVKTVSTYRMRVFQKMGFESLAEMVQYAVKKGLIGTGG